VFWADQAVLPLAQLPGVDARANEGVDNFVAPKTLAQLPAVWADPLTPICLSQGQAEGWSIGWRWHPDQIFDASKVQIWLQSLDWRRAKLVIHSSTGWVSGNALEGGALTWSPSEWRKDSRLELIFASPQDESALTAQLAACLA